MHQDYLVDVMSKKDKVVYWLLVGSWLALSFVFWSWWFGSEHVTIPVGIAINSLLIAYDLLMPAWFFFFLGRMRQPNPKIVPPTLRVAMVTTMVPGSEPWPVVEKTLQAMLNQEGEYDVWLLDEGDDLKTKLRCRAMGVKHFSRRRIEDCNRPNWPFKVRTKEGNYNAWYDMIGFRKYDVVVQMDTDHVPQAGYLAEMLRPFADPKVAYVAAPSICNGNAHDSWVVMARAEIEATLHGALQSGYNGGWAPLMIGSHYAVRTEALRLIGGLRETLAEDHSTTLAFASAGFRGVFAPRAIAVGDGAPSFPDAMIQEYQWARALMEILLNLFPRFSESLPPRLFLEFLFAETWYPLFSLFLFLAHLLPIVALLTKTPWVRVDYLGFILRYSLIVMLCLFTVGWVKRRRWLRPQDIKILTWRTVLLQLTRWPWILVGCGEALVGFFMRRQFNIRVTPKGVNGSKPLPVKILLPYVVTVLLSAGTAIVRGEVGEARGYYYFALANSAIYTAVLLAVVVLHISKTEFSLRLWWRQVALMPVASVFLVVAFMVRGPEAIEAISWIPVPVPPAVSAAMEISDGGGVSVIPLPTSISTVVVAPVFSEGLLFGVYDPIKAFPQASVVTVEETFLPWRLNDATEFISTIEEIIGRKRTPLVTIEPWPFGIDGLGQQTLLEDISNGRYDSSVSVLAKAAKAQAPQVILLRWGHEMELDGLYPWSQGDPESYIKAYHRVVNIFRQEAVDNVRWIWSPAGNSGAEDYYPGGQYVDYIGVTILADEDWDQSAGFATTRSFVTLMREKYWFTDYFGKPILAAEVGVSINDTEAKERWLTEAAASLVEFPRLTGWIYFNQQQPEGMAHAGRPNWRLTSEQIQALLSVWPRN